MCYRYRNTSALRIHGLLSLPVSPLTGVPSTLVHSGLHLLSSLLPVLASTARATPYRQDQYSIFPDITSARRFYVLVVPIFVHVVVAKTALEQLLVRARTAPSWQKVITEKGLAPSLEHFPHHDRARPARPVSILFLGRLDCCKCRSIGVFGLLSAGYYCCCQFFHSRQPHGSSSLVLCFSNPNPLHLTSEPTSEAAPRHQA